MPMNKRLSVTLALAIGFSSAGYAACDSDDNAVKEPVIIPDGGSTPTVDAGNVDSGNSADSGPTDCVMNPTTHAEIINGCTDAVKITKNPTLPLQYSDGGLPPLP